MAEVDLARCLCRPNGENAVSNYVYDAAERRARSGNRSRNGPYTFAAADAVVRFKSSSATRTL